MILNSYKHFKSLLKENSYYIIFKLKWIKTQTLLILTNLNYSSTLVSKPYLSIIKIKMLSSWSETPVSVKVPSCPSSVDPNLSLSTMVSNQPLTTLENLKSKLVMKSIHKLRFQPKWSSIKWRFMTVLGLRITKVKNMKYQIHSSYKDYWIFTKTSNWFWLSMSHISVKPEPISYQNWSEIYTKHSKPLKTLKKVSCWLLTEQAGTTLLKIIKNKSKKWLC